MLPSSAEDFAVIRSLNGYINATQKSAIGSSEDKVKFMKLAWDSIGSSLPVVIPSTRCSMPVPSS